jgi:hypothetical protein
MPRPSEMTPELHRAGATVLHRSPFDDLDVPVSSIPLDPRLWDRWVTPFYMDLPDRLPDVEASLRPLLSEVSPELITALLAEFNWRPRKVGAFLVALEPRPDFEDLVGRLLLRSDVCYAGRTYCLALARINTAGALEFLQEYLRYYLTRPDLWFDQSSALAAVRHLDQVNRTSHAREFDQLWSDFVRDKPNWNLDAASARFGETIERIVLLQASH